MGDAAELGLDDLRAFEALPVAVLALDLGTLRILAANGAACDRLGVAHADLLERELAGLLPADEAARIAAAPDGADGAGRWPMPGPDGTAPDLPVRWRRVRLDGRAAALVTLEPDGAAGPATYETQRAGEAAAPAMQDARMRAAERLLGLGPWELDLDRGTFTLSRQAESLLGADEAAFAPDLEGYLGRVHPGDRPRMQVIFSDLRERAAPLVHFVHRVVTPSGRVRHLRGVGERLTRGDRALTVGLLEDVTETVTSQSALSKAERLLRIAGEKARLGGWRVELDAQRIFWTHQTCAIHEMPPGHSPTVEEGIGFYAPEYRDRISAAFWRCVNEGVDIDEVCQLVTATGRRIWVRSVGSAERNARGEIVAVDGAFQEITELRAAEDRADRADRQRLEVLESISDAFFALDRDWCFSFVNAQAERLMAQPRAALVGRNIWDVFPAARGSRFQEEYERAVATGEARRFQEHYAPLETWFEVTAYPTPEGLGVYFRDVTAERARQEHLRLLETAVARQSDMLTITEAAPIDAPDGPRIVYVNDAFVRCTGYGRAEAIGATPRILQGPRTDRAELDRIRAALEAREPVRSELVNYTKAGEERHFELDIVPLAAADGRHSHWVSVQRDVTDRKRAEAAERRSEERFRLIAAVTQDVIWDWDVRTDDVWWNRAMEKNFGYRRDTLRAGDGPWKARIHPEDRERVAASFDAALSGTTDRWSEEYRFRRADGGYANVIDRAFILRDAAGKPVRMLGSMIDQTEQRSLESRLRQAQKLEAVGQLTGGVAHDFNNLLTVIMGAAEELSANLADRPGLRALSELTSEAAQRGAELTSRLLAFARRQALKPRRVDLNRLVGELEPMIRRTLPEAIDVEVARADGLWPAEIDPGQTEMALLNLVINARDAMPDTGRLTIETANRQLDSEYTSRHDDLRPGAYVMLSVSDTGTGMDADTVARAFEPFFTTKPAGLGSGLGLSMVFGFAKQSRGHLSIYSEPGVGTTVRLYFPCAGEVAEAGAEDAPASAGGPPAPERGREHVLVAEDDVLVRENLTRQLRGLGYRVTRAGSGAEALDVLREAGDVDLLLTDVVMPGGMDGRQLADAALAIVPDLRVLFTSGYAESAIIHNGRLDPDVALLSKPYRLRDLAAKLREVLGGGGPAA